MCALHPSLPATAGQAHHPRASWARHPGLLPAHCRLPALQGPRGCPAPTRARPGPPVLATVRAEEAAQLVGKVTALAPRHSVPARLLKTGCENPLREGGGVGECAKPTANAGDSSTGTGRRNGPDPLRLRGRPPSSCGPLRGELAPPTSGLWRLGNMGRHRGRCLEPAQKGDQELQANPQVEEGEVLVCPPTCSCRWGKSQRSGNQTPHFLGILILHWAPTQAAQEPPWAITSQPLGRDGWAEVSHYGSWLSGLCGQESWT